MYAGQTVFSQLMSSIPLRRFHTCVKRYGGNRKTSQIKCLDLFYIMAFSQLTHRRSFRDTISCLHSLTHHWYHMGLQSRKISRTTLADALATRDWRIFADFAAVLVGYAKKLYADQPLPLQLDASCYAVDSTTIDLCLSIFPWAPFRQHKAAIKLHTMMNIQNSLPEFIWITSGKVHDINAVDKIPFTPGSYYIFDRAYIDFGRMYRIQCLRAYFVIRAKGNLDVSIVEDRLPQPEVKVFSDQLVRLNGPKSSQLYPDVFRLVKYYDNENNRYLSFMTNDLELPPQLVADLYRCRWDIEQFFRSIKQNLGIHVFFGTTANAVKTQIWIAISVYVLIAIVKKRQALTQSLQNILQVTGLSLFERRPLKELFCHPQNRPAEGDFYNLLPLFK